VIRYASVCVDIRRLVGVRLEGLRRGVGGMWLAMARYGTVRGLVGCRAPSEVGERPAVPVEMRSGLVRRPSASGSLWRGPPAGSGRDAILPGTPGGYRGPLLPSYCCLPAGRLPGRRPLPGRTGGVEASPDRRSSVVGRLWGSCRGPGCETFRQICRDAPAVSLGNPGAGDVTRRSDIRAGERGHSGHSRAAGRGAEPGSGP